MQIRKEELRTISAFFSKYKYIATAISGFSQGRSQPQSHYFKGVILTYLAMKKAILTILALTSFTSPTLATPKSDMEIIRARICPMFDSGMTSGEVLMAVKNMITENLDGRSGNTALAKYYPTIEESTWTLARTTVTLEVFKTCEQYSPLIQEP
ncbi:MAG: hypothetical protein ACRC11_10975 [Xenococcaceae cyanobacterium]